MAYRARRAAAVLSALLLSLVCGACAVISGLDGYSQASCPGDCDGGHDETPVPSDSGTEDAPPTEAGCALGTPANCSACGVACSTSTGAPSCGGSACTYACNAGRQDCDTSTAPNTDGCECAGSACCGTGCQTIHTSGIASPMNYYDCNTTGNTTQTQAMAACTGTGGTGCSAKNATCGGILGFGGKSTSAACGMVGGTCYCWVYSGQNSGQANAGSNGCNIACGSGSAWN